VIIVIKFHKSIYPQIQLMGKQGNINSNGIQLNTLFNEFIAIEFQDNFFVMMATGGKNTWDEADQNYDHIFFTSLLVHSLPPCKKAVKYLVWKDKKVFAIGK